MAGSFEYLTGTGPELWLEELPRIVV